MSKYILLLQFKPARLDIIIHNYAPLVNIRIQPFTPPYAETVKALLLHIWEEEFDFKGLDRPDLEDIPTYYQANPNSNFWIALHNQQLVGTVAIQHHSDEIAFLKRMAVAEQYRSHGLGTTLLETALTFAAHQKYEKVYAGTVEENPNAIKFYQHHGFRLSEHVPDDITAMSDSICLEYIVPSEQN